MSIFTDIIKMNPDTVFGKYITKNIELISMVSLLVYFIPLITLIIANDGFFKDEVDIPVIYLFLFIWYFVAVSLKGTHIRKTKLVEVIEFVVCFPFFVSIIGSFFIVKIFRNKDRYPDVNEDKLFLHQRKIKIKRVKKKIRRKKLWVM